MITRIFNLRNVIAIAICLAGVTMFSACDEGINNGGEVSNTGCSIMNGDWRGTIIGKETTIYSHSAPDKIRDINNGFVLEVTNCKITSIAGPTGSIGDSGAAYTNSRTLNVKEDNTIEINCSSVHEEYGTDAIIYKGQLNSAKNKISGTWVITRNDNYSTTSGNGTWEVTKY